MELPQLKPLSKMDLDLSEINGRKIEIQKDIQKIEYVDKDDEKAVEELHRYLDGKYQSCISEWGKSMWFYSKDKGFDYYMMGKDSMLDNLKQMKPKLEAFALNWNATKKTSSRSSQPSSVNVTVNNEINVNVSVEKARERAKEMTSLTDEQTKELLEKIDTIENTLNSKASKKTKWEKLKPIFSWLADKSFDIGMTLLPLLIKIQD